MSRLPVIGITCYPSAGGSGVIASELGVRLARSGCEVHFIASSLPLRLRRFDRNIFFHKVESASYPVFLGDPYTLALATMMSEVARRHDLDILHVHYAIPHAAAGFLAREMTGGRLRLVTTLHGTDVTLVGQEPSFLPIIRFLIQRSDAVTAVSRFLQEETARVFAPGRAVEVIPNFVDTRLFRPRPDPRLRAQFAAPQERLLIHASNFRAVKNVPAVIEVFALVAAALPARLLLIGDGPELPLAHDLAARRGVAARVRTLGQVENMAQILPLGDLTLLPSLHESFGLVALESMSCGTPVIATNRGGTGEYIENGHNSFLCDPQDVVGMTEVALRVLRDEPARRHMAEEGRRDVTSRFDERCVMRQYLALYERVMKEPTADAATGAPA